MEKNVNFYFGDPKKAGVLKEDKPLENASSYIIFQNDFLHSLVSKLEEKVKLLETDLSEVEGQNESLEINNTCLKGYIKNQGEFNRLSKELVDIYDKELKIVEEVKNKRVMKYLVITYSSLLIMVASLLYKIYHLEFLAALEMVLIISYFTYSHMNMSNATKEISSVCLIKQKDSVKKIIFEMERAGRGNDYLNDLIDKL